MELDAWGPLFGIGTVDFYKNYGPSSQTDNYISLDHITATLSTGGE
jgi:hypothetical protein